MLKLIGCHYSTFSLIICYSQSDMAARYITRVNNCNNALYFGISVFSSVYMAQLSYAVQILTKFGMIELHENLAIPSCFLISLSVMPKIIKIPPLTPEILNNFLISLIFIISVTQCSEHIRFWSTMVHCLYQNYTITYVLLL